MPYTHGDTLLNKYRIEALIGQGAFAQVYHATHLALDAPRALKILRRDAPGMGSTEYTDFHARFQLEAQLGAKLDHPNIIRVYDFEQDKKTLILVMEYAEGGNLAGRIQRAREKDQLIPIEETILIGIDVAQGLSALHAMDAIHRDLKPSNILFDKKGHAKVADLGLAQIPGGPSLRSIVSRGLPHPGTLAYMSPEQESTYGYLSPSSDVYALGLILFESLTSRPYKNQRPGTRARSLLPDVPEWLDELLARMLLDDKQARPWDGAEVATVLREEMRKKEEARRAEEERQRAEEEARREREERERKEWEAEQKRREAEEEARKEREWRAQAEAAEKVRRAEEERRRKETEDKARSEAEQRARAEAARRPEEERARRRTQAAGPRLPGSRLRTWAFVVGLGTLGLVALFFALRTPKPPATPTTPPEALTIVSAARPTAPLTPGATPPAISTAAPTPTAAPSVSSETRTPTSGMWQNWTQVQSFPAPGDEPTGIVRIGDNLWVNVPCSNRIYHLDLEGNLVAELVMPEPGCGPRDVGLAWDGTSLWGTWWSKVIQIDPNTGQALSEFEVDLEGRNIAWDGSSLWVVDLTGNLSAYDRNGQRVRRLAIPVFGVVSAITWVNGELWMLDGFGKVTRFNGDFLEVGSFSLALPCGISSFHEHKTYGLYWDGESLWVADAIQNRIFQCVPVD